MRAALLSQMLEHVVLVGSWVVFYAAMAYIVRDRAHWRRKYDDVRGQQDALEESLEARGLKYSPYEEEWL